MRPMHGQAVVRSPYFRSELDDRARRSELDDGARVWSSQNESSSTLSIITVTALFACTLVLPSSGNQDEPNSMWRFLWLRKLVLPVCLWVSLEISSRPCSPRTNVKYVQIIFQILSMTNLQTINDTFIHDRIRMFYQWQNYKLSMLFSFATASDF